VKRRLAWVVGTVSAVTAGLGVRTAVLSNSVPAPVGVPLDQALGERNPDLRKISLKVEKSAYRLSVIYSGRTVKSYPVVFGRNPTDDKLREGDGCTPEGTFRIRGQYPHKLWSRFLWLDYPTEQSEKRFREAKRTGKVSPKATIGGQIGIHGVPDKDDTLVDRRVNWTLGCVSLRTADILELYRFTRVGTPVTIIH
jgi:murein L,D-transpeptidase YafK